MSTKAWIIFAAICVVLFGGLIVWSQKDRIDVSNVKEDAILGVSDANGNIADHVYGNKNAKVILIEYGDYQCPGCKAAHPRVKALVEEYKDHVAFVYRNFPLTQAHPNARAAAAAAEAAGLNGKYWQMHDLLFENQDAWGSASGSERTDTFTRYAAAIGLKESQFTNTLNSESERINQKINFDIALGRKSGVNGTPTFFLNGTKLTEDQTTNDEAFDAALLDEFKKQGVDITAENNSTN